MQIQEARIAVHEKGYAHIPYGRLAFDNETLSAHFGKILFTTLIKEDPNSSRLLASNKEVALHTDHIKAKYVAWQCNSQAAIGGESILLDLLADLSGAPPETLDALERIRIKSHCIFHDDLPFYQLYQKSKSIIYYAPFLAEAPKLPEETDALEWLKNKIASGKKTQIKLSEGDWLIIDNHRMLHGRRDFLPNSNRLLTRYWLEGNNKY